MKKYTQYLVIIVLMSMIIGCVSQEVKETFKKYATGIGAVGGGVVGTLAGEKFIGGKKGALIGGLLGAAIGGILAHSLTQQDQENVAKILEDPNNTNQTYSWCSDSRSITNGDLDLESCGVSGKKIMATPQKTKTLTIAEEKRECREIQIEVMDNNGEPRSTTQTSCKGNEGKWHSVNV
jgi:hypothetical protein